MSDECAEWQAWLAAGWQSCSRGRRSVEILGLLFATGRRTVISWLRAAGVSDDYRADYAWLPSVGRRRSPLVAVGRHWSPLGYRRLDLVLRIALADQARVLLAIDDSPTKRYGPCV